MNIIDQIKNKVSNSAKMKRKKKLDGNVEQMISTGSTLLDLAITGGRVKGGGIPGGILVEIFGPAGTGKTVLLCEIAGAVKRANGEVMFKDPEARLNKSFASIFDLDVDQIDYSTPNTVPEVFEPVRKWEPKNTKIINGVFADSLAALSTDMEMEGKDQYGMRRAKEFSEELRKTARILTQNNILMVASNQVRENLDAGMFGQKYMSPGGQAIGFYCSLRLRIIGAKKIKKKIKVAGKELYRIIGVEAMIEVFKSSVWAPYRQAPVTILFDYGIDAIRDNLQYIKTFKKLTSYELEKFGKLGASMDKAIEVVEEEGLEEELKQEVIALWETIEEKFKDERKPKKR